jgi:hypothetical protein
VGSEMCIRDRYRVILLKIEKQKPTKMVG